jgi:hypothetical protein
LKTRHRSADLGRKAMSKREERAIIYIALIILCSITSAFLGLTVAVWTFIQIASVVELIYMFGRSPDEDVVGH